MKTRKKDGRAIGWRGILTARDPGTKLCRAVANYLESKGGSALAIGPVSIIDVPGDAHGCFYIGVKCCGKKPTFAKEQRK